MTDRETLTAFRAQQARETLADARTMLTARVSARSIINRAYYAVFYALLALFLRYRIPVTTSRHSGLLALFDKELVHSGKIAPAYSRLAHHLFEYRQESDYRELKVNDDSEAESAVAQAARFLSLLE